VTSDGPQWPHPFQWPGAGHDAGGRLWRRGSAAHAEPSQILTSDLVKGLAAGKGFVFTDQGDVALRGFEDPVRLFEVRWREE